MNDEQLIHYTAQAMQLVLYLSMPTIIAATLVGLLIGLFQECLQLLPQFALLYGPNLPGRK